jgi:Zn-dependent peptidase ImmA (M78 family)
MSGAPGEVRHSPSSTGSVVTALGGVLREFNRTAEAVLQGLREQPLRPSGADVAFSRLRGEEQLRELRAAMPRRVLNLTEGIQIAERQAALLRWQIGHSATPILPTEALIELPFLMVTYRTAIGKSGLATKTEQGWVIVLRADEPQVRQRFSLAHEIKHALDDELLTRFPDGLYRTWGGRTAQELAERVCDHFAGCLLMPKMLLRRDWTNRMQDPSRLARRYHVSRAAMEVRLRQTGLIEPTERCGTPAAQPLDFQARQSNDQDGLVTSARTGARDE